jgi:hypothetical protein
MSIETESNVINLLKFRRDRIHRCTMRKTIEEDSRNIYYMGASITDIARLSALNHDLGTDMAHPRNAMFLFPLADEAEEEDARLIAECNFYAFVWHLPDDATFDADHEYEQCLVDARHMVRDPDYARLFGGLK